MTDRVNEPSLKSPQSARFFRFNGYDYYWYSNNIFIACRGEGVTAGSENKRISTKRLYTTFPATLPTKTARIKPHKKPNQNRRLVCRSCA
jgi:hypothetical protein